MKFLVVAEFSICWLAGLGLASLLQRTLAWRVLAVALAVAAIGERVTYLARWAPALAAMTEVTDVGAIVRSVGRPPLVMPRRDVPPALAFAADRACGNIPAVANVATVTGGNVGLPSSRQKATVANRRPDADTLTLLGARWLIAPDGECRSAIRRLGFRPVLFDDGRCVLEHPHPPDRYALLYEATPVASVEDMVEHVRGAPRDPVPIVASPELNPAPDRGAGPGRVEVVTYRPGEVTLRTSCAATRWLLAHESWSPGWEATVDGAPATIHPAAGMFLAVVVPSGQHDVVLRYRSPGLRLGLAIALLWSLVTLAAIIRQRRAAAAAPAGAAGPG